MHRELRLRRSEQWRRILESMEDTAHQRRDVRHRALDDIDREVRDESEQHRRAILRGMDDVQQEVQRLSPDRLVHQVESEVRVHSCRSQQAVVSQRVMYNEVQQQLDEHAQRLHEATQSQESLLLQVQRPRVPEDGHIIIAQARVRLQEGAPAVRQHVQYGVALNASESLMSGTSVIPLFRLGARQPCTNCGALLFPHEKNWGQLCCMKGQVSLPAIQDRVVAANASAADVHLQNDALHAIFELWKAQTSIGQTLRKYARQLNNALAMASVTAASEVVPAHGSWKPSVVICGKVYARIGSLMNTSSTSAPKFAQLWYHDPEHDDEHGSIHRRLAHMRLPAHVSTEEVQDLRRILHHFEYWLRACNPYVRDFQMACELPASEVEHRKLIIHADPKRNAGEHPGRYNRPTGFKEVSVYMSDSAPTQSRDIALRVRDRHGALQLLPETHRSCDALHYPTLFPAGDDGWHLDLLKQSVARQRRRPSTDGAPRLQDTNADEDFAVDALQGSQRSGPPSQFVDNEASESAHRQALRRVTAREYYAYRLQERAMSPDILFRAQRLFQEFCCFSWVKTETTKLNYLRYNQNQLRAELYKNLRDHVFATDARPPGRVGVPVILPATFSGSPRDLHARYQEAMAVVRKHGKPDLFITFTCNPRHPDILENLLPGQQPKDRPDIVARVFKGQVEELLHDLKVKQIFGKPVALVYTIEFQQRGLPHLHLLLTLDRAAKLSTNDLIDRAVRAELPQREAVALRQTVLTCLIHSPCGGSNPDAACMQRGRCSKHYPKPYSEQTMWPEGDLHPRYRRRRPTDERVWLSEPYTAAGKPCIVDSANVVPFNPYLTSKYGSHINVECCNSVKACKYLFKYVYKGHDKGKARAAQCAGGDEGTTIRDEIAEYEDCRVVGASEACWHLFSFLMSSCLPPVMSLPVHLEDGQRVVFQEEWVRAAALRPAPKTPLTEWLATNAALSPHEPRLLYTEMVQLYTWDVGKKTWKKRVQHRHNDFPQIARVHTVHPSAGELFYLRLLLHNEHSRGKASFGALRLMSDGTQTTSYKEACRHLGLLQDDAEWHHAMLDAASTAMPAQLRALYIFILEFCNPADPISLFNEHCMEMADDFRHKHQEATEQQLRAMVAMDVECRLREKNSSLEHYGIAVIAPTEEVRRQVQQLDDDFRLAALPMVRREHLAYDVAVEREQYEQKYQMLRPAQKRFVDEVLQSNGTAFFLDAVGGAGKTFCENLILSKLRSEHKIAIAVATSGIAATLLHGG